MKSLLKYFAIGHAVAALVVLMMQSPADGRSYSLPYSQDPFVPAPNDTGPKDSVDLPYPFEDTDANPYSTEKPLSPLHLQSPESLRPKVEYDPRTGRYVFKQEVDGRPVRVPYSMSLEQYRNYELKFSMQDYWHQCTREQRREQQPGRSRLLDFNIDAPAFETILGSDKIEIKPQGSAELIFGGNISRQDNPQLPKNLQRNPTFDFDMKVQMGVTGNIGDKIDLGINYNTEATFDFENETELAYRGKEDEIVQLIEAGNVSLPLSGTLISGSQSLFGIKTEMKFGKLTATSIVSQQRGESSVIELEGGAQKQDFELPAIDYEANRHFFLAHFFRDNYNEALENTALPKSGVSITRLEVWMTNTSDRLEQRNIVAMLDLAEHGNNIYDNGLQSNNDPNLAYRSGDQQLYIPTNETNSLYNLLIGRYNAVRSIERVTPTLEGAGYTSGKDFEKLENAQMLKEGSDYTFNPSLGYISLKSGLQPGQMLAVAFEYTYRGKTYRVGELSTGDVKSPNVLIVKLLRGTNFSPKFPNWDLMMKNVYSIGAYQVNSEDFELEVLFRDDATGNSLPYIPQEAVKNTRLLRIMGLDNLNSQMQAQPDGRFDFIERITINSQNGRVYFPVVEPFGKDFENMIEDYLEQSGHGNAAGIASELAERYAFPELYDSTQTKAQQIAEKNKFLLEGSYKSSVGSEIMLNAMNIPEGSVKVTSGGAVLTEGTDYMVDYNLGRVTILNQGLLESGSPIKISLENQSLFNIQRKTMVGTHLNYKISDDFQLGATVLNLTEKPLNNKVSFGEEAVSNSIFGLNGSYTREAPFITKMVDKIPLIDTKAKSSFLLEGEFAYLRPGQPRGFETRGESYIDDFEGTKTRITVKNDEAWYLSSTPLMFPESQEFNDLAYGYNRAKLAWYTINPDLVRDAGAPSHLTDEDKSDHRVREVYEQDLFPNRDEQHSGLPSTMSVLNLAYYPTERGPYNFDVEGTDISAGLDQTGRLKAPETRWGGVMRDIITNDFEVANIEYIEFWLMDPFVYDGNQQGGDLFLNLGNISEDVLKDGRKAAEHGLPTTDEVSLVDTTSWGRVTKRNLTTDDFDNETASRVHQDIGLDGLDDENERTFFTNYLNRVRAVVSTAEALTEIEEDPANDNYHYYKGGDYDSQQLPILERFKAYNGMEGNTPTDAQNPESYPTMGTQKPDVEDINDDNTLSEIESYYQYHVSLRPEDMVIGQNYITDMVVDEGKRKDGTREPVNWYQFKIPIKAPDQVIGDIEGFKSIRFMRMFMTNFDEEIVLRFAELDLIRSEWRIYDQSLVAGQAGIMPQPNASTQFETSAVNIEENADREPINYVLPPGVSRVIDPTNPQLRQLNEQALVLKVANLNDGDARGVYKTVDMDMRQYGRLQMWVHAEEIADCGALADGEMSAFIRIGSDFQENYYEYEIPLQLTPPGYYNSNDDNPDEEVRYDVWPRANRFDIELDKFWEIKKRRNDAERKTGSTVSRTNPYAEVDSVKNHIIRIMGNPNLSEVQAIMVGIKNPRRGNIEYRRIEGADYYDDAFSKCAEIWMNELLLTDFDEDGGWAANARASVDLADFGKVTVAGSTSTPGFGSIDQKVSERNQEQTVQYDLTSNFELGKFFPQRYGVKIPMFVGYSETFINPEYDPLDPDIPMEVSLDAKDGQEKEEYKDKAQDYTRRKSINFTNVRISNPKGDDPTAQAQPAGGPGMPGQPLPPGANAPGNKKRKSNQPRFYSISNWSASFSYSESYHHDIKTEYDLERRHSGSLNYIFNARPKPVEPFKNVKLLKSKHLALIRDANFYYQPAQLVFRTEMDRLYDVYRSRNLYDEFSMEEAEIYPEKRFHWDRQFVVKHNLTKNLKFDFTSNNKARIDEREGELLNERERRANNDTIWEQITDFGTTTDYNHNFNVTYRVPINKLPLLDFTNLNLKYTAKYQWQRGPELTPKDMEEFGRDFQGHDISNSGSYQGSLNLTMTTLYNKVGYLKEVNQKFRRKRSGRDTQTKMKDVSFEREGLSFKAGVPKSINHRLGAEKTQISVVDENGRPVPGETEVIDQNKISFKASKDVDNATVKVTGKVEDKDGIAKIILDQSLYLMMSLRNVSLRYNQTGGTFMPGYKPETKLLGMEDYQGNLAPGWPFILGWQDEGFAEYAINENRWMDLGDVDPNASTTLSTPYAFDKQQDIDITASFEPINDLRIDLQANRRYQEKNSRYYVYNPQQGRYFVESQMLTGNMSMSVISLQTAFWKLGEGDYHSQAFENLKNNRLVIAERLAMENIGKQYVDEFFDQGNVKNYNPNAPNPVFLEFNEADSANVYAEDYAYPKGYGPLSQEVLIPAFIAAYTDQSPDKVELGAFPKLPLPNWRVKYDGLSKIELLKKYFKTVSLTHAYKSTYSVGNFESDPRLNDFGEYLALDEGGMVIPQYTINDVSIRESFDPLFGLNMTWNNSLSTKFRYGRSRNLAFSLSNYYLTEQNESELVIGAGYTIKDLVLPLELPGEAGNKPVKSDLALNADFSINNAIQLVRKLELETDNEELYEVVSGMKVYRISFTADYRLTRNFNIRLYYDQVINKPKTSETFPTGNTKFGVSMRFSLVDL